MKWKLESLKNSLVKYIQSVRFDGESDMTNLREILEDIQFNKLERIENDFEQKTS